MNSLYISFFLYGYNLFILALFDLSNNYPSRSQPYALTLVITNHNPKPRYHTQEHTYTQHVAIGNKISSIKDSHIKKNKKLHGRPQFLIVDFLCIKLLLLLDSTFSCLPVALPSILSPFTTLLTIQIVLTPWFSCFHKRANLYFLFPGLTTTLSNFFFFSIPNLQDQALLPSTSIPLCPLNGATPIIFH